MAQRKIALFIDVVYRDGDEPPVDVIADVWKSEALQDAVRKAAGGRFVRPIEATIVDFGDTPVTGVSAGINAAAEAAIGMAPDSGGV